MIYIVESDTHLFDRNIGIHKDYPTESLNMFKKTNDKIRELVEAGYKVGCINAGDLEHKKFNDNGYRYKVQELLKERDTLTNGNSYIIKGNHSDGSYGMSEYEYFLKSGYFKGSNNLSENDVNIYMVDYNAEDKEIFGKEKKDGKLNIVITHKQVQWKNSPMGMFGEEYVILDDNKDYNKINWIIAGHIHKPYRFNGKMQDGTQCEVIYQGCSARPASDDRFEKGSWVLIDTEKQTVEQEFYDLPPFKEIFDEVVVEIKNDKKEIKEKVTIKDILVNLDDYKIDNGGIKDYIKNLKDVDENVKTKALEYIEKGEKNEK